MIKPSRAFYFVGVFVLFAGMAAFGALLWTRVSAMSEGFVRVVVPGEHKVALKEPGEYTLYHEHKSLVDGRVYSTAQGQGVQGLKLAVFSEPDGAPLELKPVSMSSTYSYGAHEGSALFTFLLPQPGTVRISGIYDGGAGSEAVISISQETVGDLVMTVFAAIATLFGSIFVSLAILLWTFFKRQKAIKATAA